MQRTPLDPIHFEEIGRLLRQHDAAGFAWFVDRQEGRLRAVESSDLWRAEEDEDDDPKHAEARALLDEDRFVRIPDGVERGPRIDDFVATLEQPLRDEIRQAVRGGRGAYRRMRDLLYRHDRLADWQHFEEAHDRQLGIDWCTAQDIPFVPLAPRALPERPLPAVYTDQAELYDLIYGFKDYPAECRQLEAVLSSLGIAGGARLLEGACGTGNHLVHLAQRYRVDGFDRSEDMVAVARTKAPKKTRLWAADLRTFEVDAPYDGFLCLFSSIGYLLGPAPLQACAASVAKAVRPGGALIVEPWFPPDRWDTGRPTVQSATGADVVVTRVTVAARDGDIAVTPMHYLVGRRDEPVESFVEEHRLWLAPTEVLVDTFGNAGFDVRFDPVGLGTGRGLLVGVRHT